MGCCCKCRHIVAILCVIIAIWIGLLQSISGTNYHESLPKWGLYVTYTVYYSIIIPFRVKHIIFDQLFDKNNPKNVSVELRALTDSFEFFKPFDQKWNGPDDESIFLEIYDRVCNALSYLVPLPQNTSINSQLLLSQQFIVSLREILLDKYELTIPNQAHATLTSRIFVPRTVKFLWILGDESIDNSSNAKTILFIHGGGYVLCGPSHFGAAAELSKATKTRVLFILYSKPPHSTIPKQVNQILTVYFYIIEYMKISPNNIIIGGDSAGGGLSVLLLQKLTMLGLNEIYPKSIFLISPFVDLTMNNWSEDMDNNDVVLDFGYVKRCAIMSVGYDKNKLNCPFHSALYGHNIIQLPNIFIIVSRHEVLFNDSQLLVKKLKNDCKDNCNNIIYEIEEYRPHVSPIFIGMFPESKISFDKVVNVINHWYQT